MATNLRRTRAVNRATVSFSRATAAAYDPTTDRTTAGLLQSADTAARAIEPSATDWTRYEAQGWRVSNTLVLEVDAWPLGSFTPQPDDSLLWAGIQYTVKELSPIAPNGTAQLYRVVAVR